MFLCLEIAYQFLAFPPTTRDAARRDTLRGCLPEETLFRHLLLMLLGSYESSLSNWPYHGCDSAESPNFHSAMFPDFNLKMGPIQFLLSLSFSPPLQLLDEACNSTSLFHFFTKVSLFCHTIQNIFSYCPIVHSNNILVPLDPDFCLQ